MKTKLRALDRRGGAVLFGVLGLLWPGCSGPRMEKVPGPGDLVELSIQGRRIEAEVALDEPSRQRGLMYRSELPPHRGMLFIWPESQRMKHPFWMRNTSIPLSIAFLDDEGKILQVEDLEPHDERHKVSKDEVRYALEVNRGWFQKNGLGPGAAFDEFRKKVGGLDAR